MAASQRPADVARDGYSGPDPIWTRLDLPGLGGIGAALLVFFASAIRSGLRPVDAIVGLGAIALTQVLPGAVIWRALRPRAGWLLEDLVAGFAIGSAVAVPVQVVAGLSHQRWLALALPLLLTAALLAVPSIRARVRDAEWAPTPWWFGPALGVISLAGLTTFRAYTAGNRLTWSPASVPHIDTFLHQALAGMLLNRGPVGWPTVVGEDLGYHWFGHAWMAQVSASSHVELDAVLMRILPAFIGVVTVAAIGIAGLRLTRSAKVGVAAATIATFATTVTPFGARWLADLVKPDSPTLGLGAPAFILLVVVLAMRWRGELSNAAYWLIVLLATVAAGSKGSTLPLVVAGLALALAAMWLWNRKLAKPVLVDFIVTTACLGAVMVVVFHGSSAGLVFDPEAGARQTATFTLLGSPAGRLAIVVALLVTPIATLARTAMGLFTVDTPEGRRDPLNWLLIGGTVAAAIATTVLAHPGRSQGYFVLTSLPLAGLASAIGMRNLWHRYGPETSRRVAGYCLAAGIAALYLGPTLLTSNVSGRPWRAVAISVVSLAALVAVAWFGRRVTAAGSLRNITMIVAGGWFAASCLGAFASYRTVAPEPHPPFTRNWPGAVTQGEVDTARYIRDHSKIDDIVMTNRHCWRIQSPFRNCDSRRWVASAFSERQSLVEGWTASPRATELAPQGRKSITIDYWKPNLLRLNDTFIAAPTAAARATLWRIGVRWVYMEYTQPHARTLAPYATLEFSSPDASAWKLLPPSP